MRTLAAPLFRAPRRVVVTGLGLVTPLGWHVPSVWQRVLKGASGVTKLPAEYADLPSRVGALVTDFDPLRTMDSHSVRVLPRSIQFAMSAAADALADAKFLPATPGQRQRAGVAIGTGISGIQDILEAQDTLVAKGHRRISPYMIPNALVNMAAGHIGIRHGLEGPTHAVSTACATGAHAIGDAFRFVSLGDADVMVCGGTDACITPVVVAGFCRAKALSTAFNDRPTEASRPWDAERDGFVIGEGAGVLVLEEREHALARNAPIYAELRGYGLTGDAHHITSPPPDGRGAVRCMQNALMQAGITAAEVGHVNAHATSTPLGDAIEARAIREVFGDTPLVTSTKSSLGHLLGAAGAVEAIMTVLALHSRKVPGTLNLNRADPDLPFFCRQTTETPSLWAAVTNSFGFGGTNASLCFTRHE